MNIIYSKFWIIVKKYPLICNIFVLAPSLAEDTQNVSGWDSSLRGWGLRMKMSLLTVSHVYYPEAILNSEYIYYLM